MTLPLAQGGRRVLAFDLSLEMVREASRLVRDYDATAMGFVSGDATRLPFAMRPAANSV